MGGIQVDDIRIVIVGANGFHTSWGNIPNNHARIRNLLNRYRILADVFGHACAHPGSAYHRGTIIAGVVSFLPSVTGYCRPADCCPCSERYSSDDAGNDGWGWAGLDKGDKGKDGAEEGSGESRHDDDGDGGWRSSS